MEFLGIQHVKNIASWEDAIKQVSQPLVDQNKIETRYQDAMIENVKNLGPYIVLMPGVAMPHSRPEDGALDTAIALMTVEEPVTFPDGEGIWLFICLAARSSDEHLDAIEEIVNLLEDDTKLEKLRQARSIEDIKKVL